MSKKTSEKNKDNSAALWAAAVLSVIVFALGAWTFIAKDVPGLTGNEIGDFFAGFAGALAFIWIVATIFLQKDELKFQREELELQRKEVTRLADESALQSQALSVNAKTLFQDRWERGITAFLEHNCERFRDFKIDLINEKINSKEIEAVAITKAKSKNKGTHFDKVSNMSSLTIYEFLPADSGSVKYSIKGAVDVGATGQQATTLTVLDSAFHISNNEMYRKILKQDTYIDYVRDLVTEGLALNVESMMRSKNVRKLAAYRLSTKPTSEDAQIVELLISFLIDRELENAISE